MVVVLSSFRRYSQWLDNMLACCREKESCEGVIPWECLPSSCSLPCRRTVSQSCRQRQGIRGLPSHTFHAVALKCLPRVLPSHDLGHYWFPTGMLTSSMFTSSRSGRTRHEGNYCWSAVMMKSRQSGLSSHAFYPVTLKISSSALSSPSAKCQAMWLWYFRHCAVSGLPSHTFYPVALKNLFLSFLTIPLHYLNGPIAC